MQELCKHRKNNNDLLASLLAFRISQPCNIPLIGKSVQKQNLATMSLHTLHSESHSSLSPAHIPVPPSQHPKHTSPHPPRSTTAPPTPFLPSFLPNRAYQPREGTQNSPLLSHNTIQFCHDNLPSPPQIRHACLIKLGSASARCSTHKRKRKCSEIG
jgi:hypothetical protein